MKLYFVLAILLMATLTGCGYSTSSLLPPELDSIHIQNFSNKIDLAGEISNRRSSHAYRPGMETAITREVINRFIFDGTLEIEIVDEAALILKGALVDFRQFPLSYDGDNNVEEFRIEISVDLELYDNLTRKIMWKQTSFMGQTSYTVSGPHSKTEAEAIKDAINDLASRIVEEVVESW